MSIAARHVTPGGFVGTSRKPSEVRGLMLHMAESGPGRKVSDYLAGKPSRNVSVQYTIELDGEIVAMVPELVVAGSLDPHALRDDTGPYYGRAHLDYVLGKAGSLNPNRYVIAVEIGGRAKDGPNAKQIASAARLMKDLLKRYPNIKPLGHRDQQDVKPCPGGTAAMRLLFTTLGGHGKDYRKPRPAPKPVPAPVPTPDQSCADALVAARAQVDDLTDQVSALQAAIASAVATLDAAVPQGAP